MDTDYRFKDHYGIEDLLEIMHILRSPGGCPWDARQTHESIRKNFIEEVYEVIEAINKQDADLLKEELGDVLLQIVFHAEMEQETGNFSFDDVCDGICKKLIERHPHVFGDVVADTPDAVLENWDAIKRKKKQETSPTQIMQTVPRELPALMRSTKVQQRAAKVGFDWPDVSGALDKVREETGELEQAILQGDAEEIDEELGDLLFSVVNVSRFTGVDAEEALTAATDKFIRRFSHVEALANERGIDMAQTSLQELDRLWDESKQRQS